MKSTIDKLFIPRSTVGKMISVLLAVTLAMMAWDARTLQSAFATDGQQPAAQASVQESTPAEATPEQSDKASDEVVAAPTDAQEQTSAPEQQTTDTEPASVAANATAQTGNDLQEQNDAEKADEADPAETNEQTKQNEDADDTAEKADEQTKKFPAVTLSANGVTVTAPEGALPEGTTISVSEVSGAAIAEAVESELPSDEEVVSVIAYDITLYDADGNEIQPKKPVQVTLPHAGDGDEALYHADTPSATPEKIAEGSSGTATHFSIYAVVVTADAGTDAYEHAVGAYNIKIRYEDQNGNLLGNIPERTYQMTAGMSITVDQIVAENSEIVTDEAVYTFENAYFYWTGHYSGTKCYVTSFTAQANRAGQYGSHLQFSGTLYGTDGKGTAGTWDYNDTGVLHLVYSTEDLLTLTYHSNYGQDLTSAQRIRQNSSVTAMTYQQAFGEVPTNYTFMGWATSSDGDVAYAAGSSVTSKMTSDIDLYAVWSVSEDNAVIHYIADPAEGGNLSSTTEVLKRTYSSKTKRYRWDNPKGSTVTEKDGWVFTGWYCGDELVTTNKALNDLSLIWSFIDYNDVTGECSGATFTARFEKMATITYTASPASGGSVSTSSEKAYVGRILPSGSIATTGDGYYFMGWYCGDDLVTTSTRISRTDIDRFAFENGKYKDTAFEARFAHPESLTLTASGKTVSYNGAAQTASGYEGLPEGKEFSAEQLSLISATGSGKNAGKYPVTFAAGAPQQLRATDGTLYNVTYEPSTLVIEKRNVTLTSASDTKEYDGTPLENDTVTVSGEGWAAGEGATYNVTGSQTLPGTSDNDFTYNLTQNTLADNYNVKTSVGTLEVTDRSEPYAITIESASDSVTYDGSSHDVSGFVTTTFTFNGNDYTVTGLSASASGKNAGDYTNTITGTAVVSDEDGNDVTDQFSVTTKEGKLSIAKRTVTLTSASDEKEYDGSPLTNDTVSVSGDGWADGEGATWTVTGSQITPGSSDNTFTYELNEGTLATNYTVSVKFGKLTVDSREDKPVIEIKAKSNSDAVIYDGQEHSVPAELDQDTFVIEGKTYTVSGLSVSGATGIDVGEYPNTVTGTPVVKDAYGNDVTDQFTVHVSSGALTISKRIVILTSDSAEKEYDGKALTADNVDVKGMGWADGEGATYNVTGSQLIVGNSENTFAYTLNANTQASNYAITTNNGTLRVSDRENPFSIEIQPNSAEEVYDGVKHTVSGFEKLSFEVEGATYTVSGIEAYGEGTNAATYENVVSGTPIVTDAFGNDVTSQFNVQIKTGSLTISKREVVLTSGSAERQYNGKPLENSEVAITGNGWATGEGATYNVTGSQVAPGQSANSFTYELAANTSADNYNITTHEGTLKVTDRAQKYSVTLQAESDSVDYDGKEHSVNGYEVVFGSGVESSETATFVIDGASYKLSGLSATISATNAGEYANVISGTAVVTDAYGNDVSNQFDLHMLDGKLLIRQLHILAGDPEDTIYNGEVQMMPVQVTSETGTVLERNRDYLIYYGYAIDAGTVEVTIQGIGNYSGTATVSYQIKPAPLAISTESASKTYDGSKLTANPGPIVGLVHGETAGIRATGSITNAGSTTNTYEIVWDGTAKESNYKVETEVLGTLEVAKRNVTLSVEDVEKEYDGKELLPGDIIVSGDGWAAGEGATYSVSGSQLLVGESTAEISYTLNANTSADNYNITVSNGTLKVTDRSEPYKVTVESKSDSILYDGSSHEISGFVTTSFNFNGNDYTVTGLFASASGTNAGDYTNEITGTTVVSDAAGNDVTKQFSVSTKEGKLTIDKRTLTLTSASDEKEYDGSALTNDAVTVSGDDWADNEGATYDVTGSQVAPGSSDNIFTYKLKEGTLADNYVISVKYGKLTVTSRDDKPVIEVKAKSNSDAIVYDGKEHSVPAELDQDTFSIDDKTYTVSGLSVSGATSTDVGEYPNTVSGTPVVTDEFGNNVTDQFIVNVSSGMLRISKRNVVLTSASDEKEYDGKALTADSVDVSGMGWADNEGATYNVTGSQLTVGSSANAFSYTLNANTKASNYTISVHEGTLSVTDRETPYSITVKPNSANKVYDGTKHTVSGFENLSVEVEGETYTVSGLEAYGEGIDAATYENAVSGTAIVTDVYGNDVTSQFDVTIGKGSLTIAKRNVVLTSGSSEREYNGKPLENDEVTVTGAGWADGEGATYNVTGSQLVSGESANSFTYELTEATSAGNYDIETHEGILKVTDRTEKFEITLTSGDGEGVYDGTEHTVSGIEEDTFTIDGVTYTVEGVSSGITETHAGEYVNEIPGTPIVRDEYGNDVTDQFDIDIKPGTLKISARSIVLTSASAEKEYDGKALRDGTITVSGDGWVEGDGATYSVTGSQTQQGTSENVFTYKLDEGTLATNYEIECVFGKLTVNAAPVVPPTPGDDPTPDPTPGDDPTPGPNPNPDPEPGTDPTPGPAPIPGQTPVANDGSTPTPAPQAANDQGTVPAQGTTTTPAANTASIDDTENALAGGESVSDDDNPLTNGSAGCWSLFDVVMTIVAGLLAVLTLLGIIGRRREDGEDEEDEDVRIKRRSVRRILSLIPALAAIIALLLTQDFTQPMAIFDQWWWLFAALALIEIVCVIWSRKHEEDPDDDDRQVANATA